MLPGLEAILNKFELVKNLVYNMTMIKANIHDVKAHLSEYLAKVEAGESIIICKRNVPIAELHAIPQPITTPRPIGLAKGKFTVPASFFDELPDDILKAFGGDEE